MADNVSITAGTGTTIAADDIGAGVLVQRVKSTWGPDGTANDTDVATGKPMPVQLRSSTGTAMADTSGLLISTSNASKYVAVAASQTDAVIQASTGASGDYLDHVVVVPATTAAGVVTIKDNATAIISYPGGGTTALLSLIPFTIFVGAVSSSGAWKITTGANVSVLAVGRFS